MKKLILIVIIALLASACTTTDEQGHPGAFSPKPMFMSGVPQDETTFSRGFRDGCYNYIGQTGFGMMRIYSRAPDPQLVVSDKMYSQGYVMGDRYCSVYVNRDIIL